MSATPRPLYPQRGHQYHCPICPTIHNADDLPGTTNLRDWYEAGIAIRSHGTAVELALAICSTREKSVLGDCAYQGPPPKKWAAEMGLRYEGYNECLRTFKELARRFLELAGEKL